MEAQSAALLYRDAVRAASAAIRPVIRVEQGSGRLVQCGTAFLIGSGGQRVVVTAAHVLGGAEVKRLGVSREGSLTWPARYQVLRPIGEGAPDADVAYFRAEVDPAGPEEVTAALPVWVPPGGEVPAGLLFVAAGYPVSRSGTRDAQNLVETELMSTITESQERAAYTQLGLDPEIHIAVRYDRATAGSRGGTRQMGAKPRGMSGGPLLYPNAVADGDGEPRLQLAVAGVLVRYHAAPANILVATRMDALLDAVLPRRPVPERMYRSADV